MGKQSRRPGRRDRHEARVAVYPWPREAVGFDARRIPQEVRERTLGSYVAAVRDLLRRRRIMPGAGAVVGLDRGHLIVWGVNDRGATSPPFYLEKGAADLVDALQQPRPCALCGVDQGTRSEPDSCLGPLPGVAQACCGHGVEDAAYVTLDDYRTLVGRDALAWFAGQGRGPQRS